MCVVLEELEGVESDSLAWLLAYCVTVTCVSCSDHKPLSPLLSGLCIHTNRILSACTSIDRDVVHKLTPHLCHVLQCFAVARAPAPK